MLVAHYRKKSALTHDIPHIGGVEIAALIPIGGKMRQATLTIEADGTVLRTVKGQNAVLRVITQRQGQDAYAEEYLPDLDTSTLTESDVAPVHGGEDTLLRLGDVMASELSRAA